MRFIPWFGISQIIHTLSISRLAHPINKLCELPPLENLVKVFGILITWYSNLDVVIAVSEVLVLMLNVRWNLKLSHDSKQWRRIRISLLSSFAYQIEPGLSQQYYRAFCSNAAAGYKRGLLTCCLSKDLDICCVCIESSSPRLVLDSCILHTGILSTWYLLPGQVQIAYLHAIYI